MSSRATALSEAFARVDRAILELVRSVLAVAAIIERIPGEGDQISGSKPPGPRRGRIFSRSRSEVGVSGATADAADGGRLAPRDPASLEEPRVRGIEHG